MAMRLFRITGVEEQWQSVIEPWLRERVREAWRDPRPTVVFTPSRAESFYLRSRLVESGLSFLGLRFWTPSDARSFLLEDIETGLCPAGDPELKLVARSCAERLLQQSPTPDPSLESVVREPGPFLRAYDLLLGAGWEPARDGAAYGRELAQEFKEALEEKGVATQAGIHRVFRWDGETRQESLIASLLVAGFNSSHWPLWDLLRATVAMAEDTTMTLMAPRYFGGELDELWIGSWEEALQVSADVPGDSAGPSDGVLDAWAASYQSGTAEVVESEPITFLASADLATQVKAVVLRALAFLADKSCVRLGIVFPEENALALKVGEELRRLGISLDDGTGYQQPGLFERRPWQAWLNVQEEPSVGNLLAWVRACEAVALCSGSELDARTLATVLDGALGESLVDDLAFLALYLDEARTQNRARIAAEFLRERIQLPEEGTFAEFFNTTRRAMEDLGWAEHLARLEIDPASRKIGNDERVSRRIFLGWLREATDSRARVRGPEGNHFYGKVHLLIYAQMPGQTWSHLILTGLNEGRWPRAYEAGAFGSRYELTELNRRARELNTAATRQGRQGEGHLTVSETRGHCLLPAERQSLALRDLCAALESTTSAICLCAMTAEPGRTLLPSDVFSHAYQRKTGRVLDEDAFRQLARSTADWCRAHESLLRPGENSADDSEIAATRLAYQARRDPLQPFGPYEFSYAEPPSKPIQLACKEWETALNHPASVWLEEIVGVGAWPEGKLAWPRAAGTWVHRWLAAALEGVGERVDPAEFTRRLREISERGPERFRASAKRAEVNLYPWWDRVFLQARSIALNLGNSLVPHFQDSRALSEYRLPGEMKIALPGSVLADFELRGRIDLLLVESTADSFDAKQADFSKSSCWVIDFKTGSAKNLNERKIEQGIGLQAVLYALAVAALGARSVAISLQTFDVPLKPQVQIEKVLNHAAPFRSLDLLHRRGIFGMRPDAENDYGFAPAYPMATRLIPAATLEAKWALVHGVAPLEEGA
jgi:hypothetical protein